MLAGMPRHEVCRVDVRAPFVAWSIV
jgi:hypothetical protein